MKGWHTQTMGCAKHPTEVHNTARRSWLHNNTQQGCVQCHSVACLHSGQVASPVPLVKKVCICRVIMHLLSADAQRQVTRYGQDAAAMHSLAAHLL
jgi:hypothetical protein